ncbi:DUF418 domain-containing protein [Aliikangiella coralliicola]|uniref:DUF418 domain-containing protein n=1 Tax=Aliikangiella coralliicola TaxID=2592383 RepID=A0A545UGH1_9GAMM|nr:DUF418 domain-containing protein [Aliikangiella coralliicola]TQV88582.1 DUF418 domain-containing protein [Aliikangiella coralliicola]
MNNTLQPTSKSDRIETLDLIRGFALCGILLANLMSFSGFYALNLQQIEQLPLYDRTTLFLIDFLIESKFYALFSILLGIGFWLHLIKSNSSLDSKLLVKIWYRRMFILLIIGLTHMFFIWHGDILTLYSLVGILLPLFLNKSSKNLLRWIVILMLIPLLIHLLLILTADGSFWKILSNIKNTLKSNLGYATFSQLELRTSSDITSVFFANVFSAIERPMSYLKTGRYFIVLAYFLIGVYLAIRYLPLLQSKAQSYTPSNKIIVALLIPGLIFNAIYAWIKAIEGSPFILSNLGLLQNFAQIAGAILLALAYIAIFVKLFKKLEQGLITRSLIVLGRMSLTNYLIQTSLCVFIFYGYGLSLMGKIPFYQITLFAIGVLSAQIVLSHFWLKHFSHGPLEIIWRKFTYPEVENTKVKSHNADTTNNKPCSNQKSYATK